MSQFLYDAATKHLGYANAYGEGDDFRVDNKKPTTEQLEELLEKATELEAAYNSDQWKRDRIAEYAKKSAYEQIEMMADGTFDDWYNGIKLQFPKP